MPIKKAAIVAASDHVPGSAALSLVQRFFQMLSKSGIDTVIATHIYEDSSYMQKAAEINFLANDRNIDVFFDISGGDLANSTLLHLDIQSFKGKIFFGYSDLTCILNALYAHNGGIGCLYRPYNAVSTAKHKEMLISFLKGENSNITKFGYYFLQGNNMDGVVVGGNIRCFLKLAGTAYFPELAHSILFLESRSGNADRIRAYFAHLAMMQAFDECAGILIGTFTECDAESPSIVEDLILQYVRSKPVARTMEIGHSHDSKALLIGSFLSL